PNARGSVSLMFAVYVFARSRVRPNRPAACTASSTTRSMTPFAAGSQIATRAAQRARTGSAPATRRTSARADVRLVAGADLVLARWAALVAICEPAANGVIDRVVDEAVHAAGRFGLTRERANTYTANIKDTLPRAF